MTKQILKKYHWMFIILLVILIFVISFSFCVGRYNISLKDLSKSILNNLFGFNFKLDPNIYTVLYNIRLPRILVGILVGVGLSISGATLQAVFHNPMVSPDVLGASSSAGFGAALGILMGFNRLSTTLISFAIGTLSILIVIFISKKINKNRDIGLVLTGMMVSSIFSSALSLLKLIADPTSELPAITYWLMGSLNSSKLDDFFFCLPIISIGVLILLLIRWKLNILAFGDEEAHSLGVNPEKLRIIAILSTTLITAVCVSVSGIIGWIGLVIPHIAKIFFGIDMRKVLPASMLIGSSFLLIVDNFSRLLSTSEIPIGILTSFIGAPFFIYLMSREVN
ncbi:MAG: iron ABC transporter permease [Peptoniphilus sp.]|uniref:FecCD family ABC transporter permease n=1 Tax=Peptoniphilus sp. TaxID=1971214 RepID=UPI002A761BE4|nr:iron ABC transporter permease [Peptoniphilus sp.]MDY2987220.1 iron ABC transporter permease [Peptoniphilus sp.]